MADDEEEGRAAPAPRHRVASTSRFSHYDAQNDLLHVDATGVVAHREVIDAIFDELIALARSRPSKPWVIACWKDVSFESEPEIATYYGERTAGLMQHVAGVVRYAANEPLTRAFVRSVATQHRAAGTRANLFETYEEALAAVNEARKKSG